MFLFSCSVSWKGLQRVCCLCEKQMLTDASRWPSRWWRWTEMRWPGSSGSSSKRRWAMRGLTRQTRAGARRLTCLFLNRWRSTWMRAVGYVQDYLCMMWGRDILWCFTLSLAGCPAEGRRHAGSLGENVDEHEITNLCCDSWQVVVKTLKSALLRACFSFLPVGLMVSSAGLR